MTTAAKVITLADMAPRTAPQPRAVMGRLAEAVGHVGTSGFESAFICAFFPDHAPVALFDDLRDNDSALLAPYLGWACLLDLLHDLYRDGSTDSVALLAEFAPDGFRPAY